MNDLTRLERETGIIWNDAEEEVLIWTTSPIVARQFTRKLGRGRANGSQCTEWTVSKRQIAVKSAKKRILSEAQRAVLAKSGFGRVRT